MPYDYIGGLAEPDALSMRGDGGLYHQRIGAHLRALGLEMMLGHPERLKAKFFGKDALPHLVDQRLLRRAVDLA